MPLFQRRDKPAPAPAPDVAEIVKATLAQIATASGGHVTPLANQVATLTRGQVTTAGWANPLPRTDPQVAFGPNMPLVPAPFDPLNPETGRAGPRRYQYPVSWNLQIGEQRLVPFTVLRQAAEIDLARRCIDLRISDIVGLDWDITLTDEYVAQMMTATGETSKARATAAAREQFADDITAAKQFWQTPDREADQSFSEWLTVLLEEQLVLDATSIWPVPTLGGRSPIPGIAGSVHSFMIVDGSTIKPLLNFAGGPPRPPQPAYQQILYGFPRGEFTLSDDDERLFPADQLVYRRRYPRVHSPYGYPPVEKALPLLDLWMKRQEWMRGTYNHGANPNTWLRTVTGTDPESWTPQQRRQWQEALNAELSGNTAARQQLNVLPPGWEPVQSTEPDEKYKAEYDEWLAKTVGSYFDVMPTQLGIVPRSGIGGKGHQEGEEDKMQAQARRPTVEWLVDLLNDLMHRYLLVDRALTFRFHEPSETDDPDVVSARESGMFSGQLTLNDVQGLTGRPLYQFANADRPFINVPGAGLVWLDGLDIAGREIPQASVDTVEPGAGVDDPGASSDDVSKAAEVDAYRRWARRHATPSRPFVWQHHTPVEADLIEKGA